MSSQATTPAPQLLTIREVAAMLQVGEKWVRNYQSELRTVKLGKYIRFTVSDIAAYIDTQRTEAQ